MLPVIANITPGIDDLAARSAFRHAWYAWLYTSSPSVARCAELVMSAMQERIAPGPGKVWRAFADTLPGFHVHQARGLRRDFRAPHT